jgi:monoamine oxidase
MMRIARFANHEGISTRDAEARLAEAQDRRVRSMSSDRREFLRRAALAAAAAAVPAMLPRGARAQSSRKIAIVGGGLAGLGCADLLRSKGISTVIYDAAPNLANSGRCRSGRNFFPNQTFEIGGELIDNLHKQMLGYGGAFNLIKEDFGKQPGEVAYYFGGQRYNEAAVVEQFAVWSKRADADVKAAGSPTALTQNSPASIALDQESLESYLNRTAADLPLIRDVLKVAYTGEYGLDPAQQSCLNLLLFIHMDRRAKFAPWGVASDERYHFTNGNDGVVQGIASRLPAALWGRYLEKLSFSAGKYSLKFKGQKTPETADAVVLAVPFTVLRSGVQLDASLGLSAAKLNAVMGLGYGTNEKTMVGFSSRPWFTAYDSNGASYSDVPNVQVTWETNPTRADANNAIITDYAGGARGVAIQGSNLTSQVSAWLTGLEQVYSGVTAAAKRAGSGYLAYRSGWPSNPLALGSYTCYKPGQFTTIAGHEGTPVGNLYFAGEHTDSFYSWQGFMEGALLSGQRVAQEILESIKRGQL